MFFLCWALTPFLLLFRCCFSWRNANLAGGFAGRLALCLFRFCLFVVLVDLPSQGTTVFLAEFLIQFTCLYQFQDRALERHRPYQRKKRLARKQPAEKGFQHWGTVRPFEMRLMTRTSQWDEKL